MKTWLKYFLYTLAICILAFSRQYFTALAGMTYIALFNIGAMLLNAIVGALLGLEVIISEFKKEGSWRINVPKLTLVGLPSFLIGFFPFILFSEFDFISRISTPLFNNSGIFQLIFGFIVATSFYKSNSLKAD